MEILMQSTIQSAQLTSTHPIVHVGFDSRHSEMYNLCCESIRYHCKDVIIKPNSSSNISFYHREMKDNESTSFVYSRFFIPFISMWQGWAIFCDGDFLWQDNVARLWEQRDDNYAVMVCKHDYESNIKEKAYGHVQENFPRKNWSSLIMWNCAHPSNKVLTPEYCNTAEPKELHRFLHLKDNEIGSIDLRWNWLVDEYEYKEDAGALHYTNGGPWCDIKTKQDLQYYQMRAILGIDKW